MSRIRRLSTSAASASALALASVRPFQRASRQVLIAKLYTLFYFIPSCTKAITAAESELVPHLDRVGPGKDLRANDQRTHSQERRPGETLLVGQPGARQTARSHATRKGCIYVVGGRG